MSKKPHGLIGKKRPEEARKKIGDAKRGVPRTEAVKAAISAGKMGKKRDQKDCEKYQPDCVNITKTNRVRTLSGCKLDK